MAYVQSHCLLDLKRTINHQTRDLHTVSPQVAQQEWVLAVLLVLSNEGSHLHFFVL